MSAAQPQRPTPTTPTPGTLTGRRRVCRGAFNRRYLQNGGTFLSCTSVGPTRNPPAEETNLVLERNQTVRAQQQRFRSGVLAALTALLVAGCQLPPLSPDLEHRPLHLPTLAHGAVCPVTQPTYRQVNLADGQTSHSQSVGMDQVTGEWPVYVEGPSSVVVGSGFAPVRQIEQLWLIDPIYTGPVLVRGRSLDGSGTVLFSQPGKQEMAELHLMGGQARSPVWTVWVTYLDILPGRCVGYQVDGYFFSYVIVFFYIPAQ